MKLKSISFLFFFLIGLHLIDARSIDVNEAESFFNNGEVKSERLKRKAKIGKELTPVILLTLATIKDKINELYDVIMAGKHFEESINKGENMRPMPVFFMDDQMENSTRKIRNKRFAPLVPIMEYTVSKVATMLTAGLISEAIGDNVEEKADKKDMKKTRLIREALFPGGGGCAITGLSRTFIHSSNLNNLQWFLRYGNETDT